MLEDLGRRTEDQITSGALATSAAVMFALYVVADVLLAAGVPFPAVAALVVAAGATAAQQIYRDTRRATPAFVR